MLNLIKFSAQYISICHLHYVLIQLINEWYSRISDILIETLALSDCVRSAVHLIQHPVSKQSLSTLKSIIKKRRTLELLTLQITQVEQLCEYCYSFIKNKSRKQNCSTLNPLVSIPELMTGNSLHSDWDPGRRMTLVFTFPVVSKHCHQAPNANLCLLKDSSIGCYSCPGLWIVFIKEKNKSCIFTMDRISRSLFHDNKGMPQTRNLPPAVLVLFKEQIFTQSRSMRLFSAIHSTLLPCTQKGCTRDVRRHVHA